MAELREAENTKREILTSRRSLLGKLESCNSSGLEQSASTPLTRRERPIRRQSSPNRLRS